MSKIGIVYKLVSTDINIKEIYVGSTINFRTRKFQHKTACNSDNNRTHNFNVYKYIRANGGWDTFDMIQIEEVKHDNKQQLHARERYWIEELKATLNRLIPTRTPAEYLIDNKDYFKIKNAEYYADNKDAIKVKRAEYLIDNNDVIKVKRAEYLIANKDYFKKNKAKYYQDNKESINIKKAKYYQDNKEALQVKRAGYYKDNKEALKVKQAKKYDCECGSNIRISDKAQHQKTIKHANWLLTQ